MLFPFLDNTITSEVFYFLCAVDTAAVLEPFGLEEPCHTGKHELQSQLTDGASINQGSMHSNSIAQ